MIDQKLRPWLLEVNVAPSLSSSSPYDKQVKTKLLCDTLHLVGFQVYDRKRVEDEKKKESRHRLLGFEPTKRGVLKTAVGPTAGISGTNPANLVYNTTYEDQNEEAKEPNSAGAPIVQRNQLLLSTPAKSKYLADLNSPDKADRHSL